MGLVETVGLPPKKSIYVDNLLLIQYFYDWFMCPKCMWLDMPNAFCCRLSLFCVFAKIKKTVSTTPVSPTPVGCEIIGSAQFALSSHLVRP